jgi:hypothetical protein
MRKPECSRVSILPIKGVSNGVGIVPVLTSGFTSTSRFLSFAFGLAALLAVFLTAADLRVEEAPDDFFVAVVFFDPDFRFVLVVVAISRVLV